MREMVYTRQVTGHYHRDFSVFSSASNEVAFLLKPAVSPGIAGGSSGFYVAPARVAGDRNPHAGWRTCGSVEHHARLGPLSPVPGFGCALRLALGFPSLAPTRRPQGAGLSKPQKSRNPPREGSARGTAGRPRGTMVSDRGRDGLRRRVILQGVTPPPGILIPSRGKWGILLDPC